MSAKTHTVTISDLELHDICHAALSASMRYSELLRFDIETRADDCTRVGHTANRDYFTSLYDKFHAIRCESEMLVK